MQQLREECGVFGIFDNKDASALTALWLDALQHRGQEACGIVTLDEKNFYAERRLGLVFGVFKGYVICVCIFSLINWFYPHQKWPLKAEGTYSFEIIYKGSEFLIDEFPNSEDYYDDTKDKIEKI